jgi:uncharacterized membrane protein YsdA (DUF1294 family)
MAGRRISPYRFHALVGAGITLLITVGLLLLFWSALQWYTVVGAYLVAINLTAFGYYGYDKAQAQGGRSRVPERVLHGLALAGGSFGAWLAMHLFRHKTIKGSFRLVFWCVVAIQVVIVAWVLYKVGQRFVGVG